MRPLKRITPLPYNSAARQMGFDPFYTDCIIIVMNLIQRYKRLSFWNKLFVWGTIASIVGLLIAILGFHFSSEAKTTIIGDNVGRDKITVSGDYIAGDQTIKYGSSKEEIEDAMKKALQDNESSLRMKYGEKYSVAAITPDGFVVPKGNVPSGIKVKWETGRVINMSSESVKIVAPEIIGNTDNK
jgi:hypothetical protein